MPDQQRWRQPGLRVRRSGKCVMLRSITHDHHGGTMPKGQEKKGKLNKPKLSTADKQKKKKEKAAKGG